MIKKLFSSIPFLSGLIIILGLLKLFIYYLRFDVPIKFYIGLSELALQIADDLFITIPVVIIMYLLGHISSESGSQSRENKSTEENKSALRTKSKVRKRLDKIMPYIVGTLYGFFLIGIPFYLAFFTNSYVYNVSGILGLSVIAFIILFVTQHDKLEKLLSPDGLSLSLFACVFLTLFILLTVSSVDSVERGKFIGTKIITADSTYISDKNSFFIGQSSSYVFIYNKNEKYTTILPIAEIKKIELHSK